MCVCLKVNALWTLPAAEHRPGFKTATATGSGGKVMKEDQHPVTDCTFIVSPSSHSDQRSSSSSNGWRGRRFDQIRPDDIRSESTHSRVSTVMDNGSSRTFWTFRGTQRTVSGHSVHGTASLCSRTQTLKIQSFRPRTF